MMQSIRTQVLLLSATVLSLFVAPLQAQAKDCWDAEASARAVSAKRAISESDDVDSSGLGVRGEIGWRLTSGDTSVRAQVHASVFDYTDEDRDTRESWGARVTLTQKVTEMVRVEVEARHSENIVTLESGQADQDAVSVQLQWQKGNDRVRAEAEYRERDYETGSGGEGDGVRYSAQYNRRLGSYHWVRLDVSHEDMNSDNPVRGYSRDRARIKYSLPVAKRLRVRPSVDYREWKFDGRVAQGDPDGSLRRDKAVTPQIEVAYGRNTRGFYARASAGYDFRSSNDVRYGDNAPRFEATVGFRF